MPPDGAIERLTAAARRAKLAPVATDIADALWLAGRMSPPPAGPASPPETEEELTPPEQVAPVSAPPRPTEPNETEREEGEAPAQSELIGGGSTEPDEPEVEIRRRTPEQPQPPGVPFRAPGAPALARLALARAMRSFKRQVPGGGTGDLDAEATAHQAAITDVLLPIFTTMATRWLDVAVVVDTSASMAVSGQTVKDLVATLGELGAFRDVRVWRCDTDDPFHAQVHLGAELAGAGTRHDPAELIDPRGRRVVLVVSDLLGQAWRDGRMGRALETWAKAGPVAVVQPLPQRLWDDCGVPVPFVVISSRVAAAPNRDLRVQMIDEPLDLSGADPGLQPAGVAVPVIELGDRWLAAWARLVTGESDRPYHGRAVFTGLMDGPWTTQPAEPHPDPREAVSRFNRTASTEAARLAPLLAAAAPLTLPVMLLVQRAKMPSAAPTALRELFLSGLLEQVNEPAPNPDDTVYDFVRGTRKELISNLSRQDALSVLVEVSRYLVSRLGANLDFLALLTARHPITDLDERGRAFAAVAVDVLESVGGTYREAASRLRALLEQQIIQNVGGLPPLLQPPAGLRATGTAGTMTNYSIPDAYIPVRESGYAPAGWKTVPPRNQNFVGRDDTLGRMRNMLVNSTQTAVLLPRALYGLGGVGKTQLAIEYVHRHRSDYDLVWWIAAEDIPEIRRSLVELAEQLEITVTGDTGGTIRRVLQALAERRRFQHWLLVFDNVGEPDAVTPLLPSSRHGHVLVTTRDKDWSEKGQAVQVDKFERAESVALLGLHGGLAASDADSIAAELGDLPISLAQAAAWTSETQRPVAEYLRLFNEELERRPVSDALGYPRTAAAAMSIAFNQLREGSTLAAQLLQLASYFGPEWISLELLHRGRFATPLSRRLSKILRDQAPLERAVKDISRWELARNDTRNLRFQIHRLVQRMVQEEMDQSFRDEVRETVQTMLAVANPGNPDRVAPQEARKHAELSAHIVSSGVIESEDDEARQVVLDQIRYRYIVGDYDSSRNLATDALAIWEPRFGAQDELTLIARRHLANAISVLGNPAEALEIDREVLAGFEASLGKNHEHTMATVSSVGADLRALGRFAEARRLGEENYRRHVQVLGADDRTTLQTASNFGVDMRMVGEYRAALDSDELTLSTAQRVLGRADRQTLILSANAARDLYALGRYGEALSQQRDGLPALEQVMGPNHYQFLAARRTVVMCLRKLGLTGQAADQARELLLAFRSRLGDEHPATLLMMQTSTNALRDNGELVAAIKIGEEALARYRVAFPDHPFTQVCATNLAITYRQAGRLADARRLNEGALDRLTDAFGPDHPYTLCGGTNLANDLAAAGEVEAARQLSGEVLERSRRVRGAEQPYTLACAVNHAIDLRATGDPAGTALLVSTVDLMLGLRDFGEAHPDVALARDGKRIDCDIEAPPT